MKKQFTILFLLFSLLAKAFAAEIPESLYGIWEGKDRLVFFDKNPETEEAELSIYLKPFYGWYIDRTAEPASYETKDYRPRNDATSRDSINIITSFDKINKNETYENAFEIKLEYSKRQINSIPVAIVGDKLYLNFFIQDKTDSKLYRGNIATRGLMVSEQSVPDNIGLYYVDTENNIYYDIRYWKTDMDYEDSQVLWQKEDVSFNVDKHLLSGGYNFSCVSGRSKKIRNPVKGKTLKEQPFTFTEDSTLLITDEKPYLYKLADHKTLDDLFLIVKEQNSKKKPPQEPPFKYSELEWQKIILDLLAQGDETVIKKVTEWQMDFNYRKQVVNGKDF